MKSSTNLELQALMSEYFAILLDCGFTKPSTSVVLADKMEIVQTISLHQVILRSKAELDQFAEGLDSCGVLKAITNFPGLTKTFFTIGGRPQLTSGSYSFECNLLSCVKMSCTMVCVEEILKLLKNVNYSEAGSNNKKREEDTFSLFIDYLDECEKCKCTSVAKYSCLHSFL